MMKREEKVYAVIFTVIFLIIISVPLLNGPFIFFKDRQISQFENRNLATKPQFDLALMDPFPKKYEDYYNDHFPWREEMIGQYTLFNFFVNHKSGVPGMVAVGKNNWLFLEQKERMVYRGDTLCTAAEITQMAKYLRKRTEWHQARGIHFYVSILPLKQEIYPEYLPANYRRGKMGTMTDKIIEAIKQEGGINFIEMKPALLAAKTNGQLFCKTDNHWNMRGAFYAYRTIIERVKKDFPKVGFPSEKDVVYKDTLRYGGNLANMLNLAEYLKEEVPVETIRNRRAKWVAPAGYHLEEPFETDYERTTETNDTTLPRAVIIHDSFTLSMIPYLSENFCRSVFFFDRWHYDYQTEIIEKEKPNVVLLLIYEPHINNLLDGF